jgi:3-oxoacyl-[acyl-carrier-protein] synthase II
LTHRVVVTGMGVVCPIGQSLDEFRTSLFAGRSGIGPITIFDPATLPTRIAGEVAWGGEVMRDRKVSFAGAAADQALADARRSGTSPRGEGGLSLGLGLELFSMDDLAARRAGVPSPDGVRERLLYLQTPSDLCVSILAHRHQLREPPVTYVSACASGTDALGGAFRMIASGRRRWMVAGGADSMINPLGVAGFCSIGATSTANDDPPRASRPFDRKRAGFVLGEGAGMLILERLDDARERGAPLYAEIAGYGASFDAHGISEPHPDGRGALQAMSRALAEAQVSADQIDCVNAHGTGTPKNDAVETLALTRLLGARARRVPICATKSMIGHLIAAAGAVEAIAAITGMNASVVHPTINLDHPDPACDLDYVPHVAREHAQRCVLSNSFAFGGQNASIVFRRPDV